MDDIRWLGMTHEEIFEMVWSGPGHVGSATAQGAWRRIADTVGRIAEDLHQQTVGLRAGWEGTAADTVDRNLRLFDVGLRGVADGAARNAEALERQAEYVATARNSLPPPPERVPPEVAALAPGVPIVGPLILLDLQAKEVERAELAQQAVQVMETYNANSQPNVAQVAPVSVPGFVTQDAPATAGFRVGKDLSGAGVGLPGGFGAPGGVGAPGGQAVAPSVAPGGVGAGLPGGPVAPLPVAAGGGVGGRPGTGTGIGPGGVPVPLVPGTGTAGGAPPTGRGPGGIPSSPRLRPPLPEGGGRGFPGAIPGLPGPGEPGGPPPRAPGGGPGTGSGAGGTVPGTTATNAAQNTRGTHGFFPPGAGAGAAGAQSRERRRPSYLLDDEDAFADHRWFTEPVITPHDPLPGPHYRRH